MKKGRLILSVMVSFVTYCLLAQHADIEGAWKGSLQIRGQQMPIVFHFTKQPDASYKATFDSPAQNAFSLPCGHVTNYSR